MQLFLWPNFEKAGWTVKEFQRKVRRKDSDLHYFGQANIDVSATSTLIYTKVQNSPAWKEQEPTVSGLMNALRVLEQSKITTSQGLLMDEADPLKGKSGFIIWVNPKLDGPK